MYQVSKKQASLNIYLQSSIVHPALCLFNDNSGFNQLSQDPSCFRNQTFLSETGRVNPPNILLLIYQFNKDINTITQQ